MRRREITTRYGDSYEDERASDGLGIRAMAVIVTLELIACGLWFATLVSVGGV